MPLKREAVARPPLRRETYTVDSIGEVIVQQITLSLYMEMLVHGSKHGDAAPLAMVLSRCVLDQDLLPIFSEDEWESFGTQHLDDAMRLYDRARSLAGLESLEEIMKKHARAPGAEIPAAPGANDGENSASTDARNERAGVLRALG